MVYYRIEHHNRFRYDAPVRELIMEVRVCPRDEWGQGVLRFTLSVSPQTRPTEFVDWLGNRVHHFGIPGLQASQTIVAESVIRLEAPAPLPSNGRLFGDGDAWQQLGELGGSPEVWDMLQPSHFARPTKNLTRFMDEAGLTRRNDPLSTVRAVTQTINDRFRYTPQSTDVDSPIDEALRSGEGVCQDFAHIMIAVCRRLGVPARYVSGYLYTPQRQNMSSATHAWVECLIPGYGWAGFDPTHGHAVDDEHIRTAIGRDYADVPPTRGVYRGQAQSDLEVDVTVERLDAPPERVSSAPARSGWSPPEPPQDLPDEPQPFEYYAQQQQQ